MPDKRIPSELIDEAMKRTFAKVSAEYPNTKPVTMTPYNAIEKFLAPSDAVAITNPFTGNISYNPFMMQVMSPDDREQTVAHELTHSRQAQETPWYRTALRALMPQEEYKMRPGEMEAYQAERSRANRLDLRNLADPQTGATDIQLPSMRKKVKNGITGTN